MSFWTELNGTSFRVGWKDVGGVRTRYLDTEQGAHVLLFLHGVGGHLEAFIRNVAAHAQHYRVIALDMLGHGYTDKPEGGYEIADYVRHVVAFLDTMQIEKVSLIGTSLGGWVSTRIAAQHPDRVRTLTLPGTAGLTASAQVMERIRTLTSTAANSDNREGVRKRLEWVIKDPAMVTEEFIEARWRIYSQPSYRRAMPRLMVLQDPQVRARNLLQPEELARIVAPTLIVWTRDDPTGTLEDGLRYQSLISGARFVLFEQSAHLPQYEEAERFNALHLRFLNDPASVAADEYKGEKTT